MAIDTKELLDNIDLLIELINLDVKYFLTNREKSDKFHNLLIKKAKEFSGDNL